MYDDSKFAKGYQTYIFNKEHDCNYVFALALVVVKDENKQN